MIGTALALAAPLLLPVSACTAAPPVVYVVASHGPVAVAADFTLGQLAEMAARTGRAGKHPPLGFYFAQFGYTISLGPADRRPGGCARPATVKVMLLNRRIELGKEISPPACLAAAREHYLRHAATDDAILTQFAGALRAAFPRISLPPPGTDSGGRESDPAALEHAVRAVVDRGLQSLDAARAAAPKQVDTPEEVERLALACEPSR